MLAVILLYALLTCYAARRELWFDELLTYYTAKAPSFAAVIGDARRMREVELDMSPPLVSVVTHFCFAALGDSAYAARFPAIAGFLVGSLCFYRYVERRLTAAYGLLAMLVFWSTPLFRYSTEARAYGLLVGFFGLSMLAYDYASQPERPLWSVPLLAIAVTGMMISHFLAVFYVIPFGAAELVRSIRYRKFDLFVWPSLLMPCALPLLYLHSVSRYQQSVFPLAFQASPRQMLRYFSFSLKPEAIALLVAAGFGIVAAPKLNAIRIRWRSLVTPVDAAFTAGLVLIPFAIGAALMHFHGAFFPRYGIITALAYGLVFASLLAGLTDRQRISAIVAVLILGLYVCVYNVGETYNVLHAEHHQFFESGLRSMPLNDVRPDLPLVAASGLTFLQMDRYSDAATTSRLYYLTGGELAFRYAHASLFEGVPELKKLFSIRSNVLPYERFVTEHPRFLVLGTPDYPEDWLLRCLLENHVQVRFIGNFVGPYKDSQIFEVVMPGR